MKFVARAAKAIILDQSGKMLVLRRSATHPTKAFAMDLPGGVVEEGETSEVGLAREIKEETGLDIGSDKLILIANYVEKFNNRDLSRMLFGVKIPGESPEVVISWEHDQYDWVELSEVDLEDPYRSLLNQALAEEFQNKIP